MCMGLGDSLASPARCSDSLASPSSHLWCSCKMMWSGMRMGIGDSLASAALPTLSAPLLCCPSFYGDCAGAQAVSRIQRLKGTVTAVQALLLRASLSQ